MIKPKQHFLETRKLVLQIKKKKIANWLLKDGYFAEQYVLPPSFEVINYKFNSLPYFEVISKGARKEYKPTISDLENISFPKSHFTDRTFGIMEPKLHHDIVWQIINDWKKVINHIFNKDLKIYNYSFPIPVSKKHKKSLGSLRAGRMIYEFIEMAETDLVTEAHKFKYLVKTDIKNFYPSIYTHSIAWALDGKINARKDRSVFNNLGTRLDKLIQCSNDSCTNGVPIGPAISDLISDILLASVDSDCSKDLTSKKIDFLGVRFKDDYRFLCNSKTDAESIIKSLQFHMKQYNLSLNESKSDIKELPEGLYRPWTAEYQKFSLRYKRKITYKIFENTLLGVLQIDQKNKETGVIDKFLSELTFKNGKLKLHLKEKEVLKVFSLLLMLKERRSKSFPQILAIIELIFKAYKSKTKIIQSMTKSIEKIFYKKLKHPETNQYDLIWLTYFIKSNSIFKIVWTTTPYPKLLESLKTNKQKFFFTKDIELFNPIMKPGANKKLIKHLAIFPK